MAITNTRLTAVATTVDAIVILNCGGWGRFIDIDTPPRR
ncbi:MAG: hypothetical protein KatS3mg065_0091 [Chloroflexota bacterium]|nr:MAG: hypothetical protein KatS3mg065_0091 [Chloroflexota bacterium]